MLKHP
jgi:hypothetical protein